MPVYRSSATGGPAPDTRPQINIAAAIDAITQGSAGILHQTMLRKQAERDAAQQRAEFQLRQQSMQQEQKHRDWQQKFEMDKERARRIEAGWVPETDTPATTGTATVPVPRIAPPTRRATPGGLPAPTMIGEGGPSSTMAVPFVETPATREPAHFEPERSAATVRAVEVARLREQGLGTRQEHKQEFDKQQLERRLTANKDAASLARQGRLQIARIQANARTSGASGAGRPMSVTAIGATAAATADGLIAKFGGSYDDAAAWLASDDPEATQLRALQLPVSFNTYLVNAHAKWQKEGMRQMLSLERGIAGLEPTEAAATIQETRKAMQPPKLRAPTAPKTSMGGVTGGSSSAAAPKRAPLSDLAKQKARTDTAFAAFLRAKGYTPKEWGGK